MKREKEELLKAMLESKNKNANDKREADSRANATAPARELRRTREASASDMRELAARGLEILRRYKAAKSSLENRIISDELFWRQRYNDVVCSSKGEERQGAGSDVPRPTSAWLFNSVVNKHADLMDSFPRAVILPRERSDEQAAKVLGSVVPVIMQRCGFEKAYSDNSYYKIKHGTCAYGVFWDPSLENGLGDISIRPVDLLNLFWEPGIRELEESKNVFCVTLADKDDIAAAYPGYELGGTQGTLDVARYVLDDHVDTSDKVLLIDWYYKKREGTRTTLQYVKLAGDTVLYCSENDPTYAERGYYDHGKYPFVLDVMYPESGTPYGFGIIAVTKDAQVYIDRLDRNILENSLMQSKQRFLVKKSANIDLDEFADFNNPFITFDGTLDETSFRPLSVPSLDSIVVNVREAKINEMKETSANRDVNAGGTTGGITSGAAIATLQEAGNKVSRDIINTSYRAFVDIVTLVIELMRQFYSEERTFRITDANAGTNEYVEFSGEMIGAHESELAGEVFCRMPIFDIDVRAEKHSPYARLSQNETVMNLYKLGFFNPENAQAASVALEALEFEGRDKIADSVREGQTLMNICKQLQAQISALSEQIAAQGNAGMSEEHIEHTSDGASPSDDMTHDNTSEGDTFGDMAAGSEAQKNAAKARSYMENKLKSAIAGE